MYTPRTAAAARDEQAENPLAESTYVPSADTENDNPVLSAADKAATVSINNETSYDVDAADCLAADEHFSADGDGPQVLIYHTHSSESYTPDAAFPYTPTETSCTINGEETAQLMLVVGTDDGGLYHPDWQENLNRAASLQYRLNRTYPTLMRPLNLRTQRFNQHATHSAFLVEVGSSGNTMTEALKGIRLFGEVLSAELTT